MKIGDKVTCVNIIPSVSNSMFISRNPLTLGKSYTVIKTKYNRISVVCDNGNESGYMTYRFILTPKVINVNIKVL